MNAVTAADVSDVTEVDIYHLVGRAGEGGLLEYLPHHFQPN